MKKKFKFFSVGNYFMIICMHFFFAARSQVVEVTTTSELIDAINNGSQNDTVLVTAGTYILDHSLQPKAGMTIKGMGESQTKIKGSSSWKPSIEALPQNETPSSYLINLGSNNHDITISDMSLEGPQLHGAIYGVKCYRLDLYNLHIENFLWSSIRTFNLENGKIHDNTFVNAGGKVGWVGGALFLSWSVDSEFWNNHILKTDNDKKFFGFKGEKGTNCRFHHNTVEVNFSFEYPFLNDAYVEIDHNYFSGVISIPKYGGGPVPPGGYTFHIHHNWLTNSYAIEGTRNGAIVDHNLFDFSVNSDGGNLITNFGNPPAAEGPTYFFKNLIKNPGRGVIWSGPVYNNFHFFENHVIANRTITPRTDGLFGFNQENDFSTVHIKDNIIECIDIPRPLMRNEASYNANIENNELINISDIGSFDNPQTGNPRGVPLDSINFRCGAYEQFHVHGWDVTRMDIEKDSFSLVLPVVPVEGGQVEGAGFYEKKARVDIRALPENGYVLEKWTENNETISSDESLSVYVFHNTTINAHFIQGQKITLHSVPDYAGTLTGGGYHEIDSEVEISAIPAEGFRFLYWKESDSIYSSSHDTMISVLETERIFTAHFEEVFELKINEEPAESGTTEGEGEYAKGEVIQISASPAPGYAFSRWSENDNTYSLSRDTTIEIDGARNLTAHFIPVYTIKLLSDPLDGGLVEGGGSFIQGSEVSITAISNDGYEFDMWLEIDTINSTNSFFSSDDTTTFTVSESKVITAVFIPVYSVVVYADPPEGGTVQGGGQFLKSSETTLLATPAEGYEFNMWAETDTVNSINTFFAAVTDTTITVVESNVFTALFEKTIQVEELQAVGYVKIYPNPFTSRLIIEPSANSLQPSRIMISNITGQELRMYDHNYLKNCGWSVDLSGLEKGIYLLTIKFSDGEYTTKILKTQ